MMNINSILIKSCKSYKNNKDEDQKEYKIKYLTDNNETVRQNNIYQKLLR
jgi:hypothetical protein